MRNIRVSLLPYMCLPSLNRGASLLESHCCIPDVSRPGKTWIYLGLECGMIENTSEKRWEDEGGDV